MEPIVKRWKPHEESDWMYIISCPKCENEGRITDRMLRGEVSMICPHKGCDYHETHDMRGQLDSDNQI